MVGGGGGEYTELLIFRPNCNYLVDHHYHNLRLE
jgi:hypothetical protein